MSPVKIVKSSEPGAQKPNEVLIDGVYYDTTGFKHPGGGIIGFQQGHGDATIAFMEFHERFPKALARLKSLPHRPVPVNQKETPAEKKENERRDKMTRDYIEWRNKLKKEGLFEGSVAHTVYRLLDILVMCLIGLYIICYMPEFWYIGVVILGIGNGRCGWFMHEAGHYSLTANVAVDKFLQEFSYGFSLACSAAVWRSKHNRHHAAAQKVEHDADIRTLPLVAFNVPVAKMARNSNFVTKLWLRLQPILFVPLTSAFLISWSWQFVYDPMYVVAKKLWREAFWMISHWILVGCFVYCSELPWTTVLFYKFAAHGVGGMYIFCNFTLNHSHLDVVMENEDATWLEYAFDYSANLSNHWFVNWWMGYLNFQIEHHLFPLMPQYRFVKLDEQTKKFCKDHGFPYKRFGYFEACRLAFLNICRASWAI